MSVNAVDWALRFAPVDARHNGAARVLMCLANVADDEGRNAHPTHRKLAAWCKMCIRDRPYTAVDEKGNANDSTFAQEAFRGIWQVLGSYYQKGVVESPSGTLDGKSTENDWQAVAYDAAKEGSTAKVLDKRLAKTDGQSTLTRIDGIITMNDYIASEVVKELDDLGSVSYTHLHLRQDARPCHAQACRPNRPRCRPPN